MITPDQALQAFEAYVNENQPYCHVEGLLEDETDYFVLLALDPGMEWLLGPGPIFLSKATGKVWGEAYGNVLDKIDRMQAV